jgi:hypothetical protein
VFDHEDFTSWQWIRFGAYILIVVVGIGLFGWRAIGRGFFEGATTEIGRDLVSGLANPNLSAEDRTFLREQIKAQVEKEEAIKEREIALKERQSDFENRMNCRRQVESENIGRKGPEFIDASKVCP